MEMSEKTFLIVQHMDWEGPGQHLMAALNEAERGLSDIGGLA